MNGIDKKYSINDIVIRVSHLKKSYKNLPVLKDVNFVVKKGEIFSLLGSNGAGKTTIVKILSTLLTANSGEIIIDGVNINRAKEVKEKMSLTGQYAAVDEMLTGRENLEMIAALRGVTGKKKVINDLLNQFELTEAADRKVTTYSGGMQRKLDIAMSLIGSPAVIFLDEPTTGLDPQSRLVLWDTIKMLAEGGTTIFLTTQYLEEAERLADYIAILNEGTIMAEETMETLKERMPSNVIAFSFEDFSEMEKAMGCLQGYNVRADKDTLKLAVAVSNGVDQLTEILTCLKTGCIHVSHFEQKTPTLEDIFLNLIHEKERLT